jgi:hypothetical protein
MKKITIIVFFLTFGGYIYFNYSDIRTVSMNKTESVKILFNQQKINETIKMKQQIEVSLQKNKEIIRAVPSIELIQQEISKNPHGLPNSMVTFSKTVSGYMKRSYKSETDAKKAFRFLMSCSVTNPSKVQRSIRTYCYVNLLRLRKQYPKLWSGAFMAGKELVAIDVKALAEETLGGI